MADDSGAQHVGNEPVALTIPGEQGGARTAATVDLDKVLLLVADNLNFILQDTGRP